MLAHKQSDLKMIVTYFLKMLALVVVYIFFLFIKSENEGKEFAECRGFYRAGYSLSSDLRGA